MILLIIIITYYAVSLLTSSMKVAVEPLTNCLDTSVHVCPCFNVLNLTAALLQCENQHPLKNANYGRERQMCEMD